MQIIAHRGAVEYFPENTLEAFQKAAELAFDGVECDVRPTADGQLVIMHDKTVDRTTDGSGRVESLTSDQLGKLLIDGTCRIPTLESVLSTLPPSLEVHIDLQETGMIQSLTKLLTKLRVNPNRVVLCTRQISDLNLLADSPYRLQYIQPLADLGWLRLRHRPEVGLSTRDWIINRPWLKRIARNRRVLLYPIRTKSQLGRLDRLGISGVYSDTVWGGDTFQQSFRHQP